MADQTELRPTGRCRACGADMLWAAMPSGRSNPLNLATCEAARLNDDNELVPAPGVIAYNAQTAGGAPVTKANLGLILQWIEAGRITAHTSHFSDCPERRKFKRD